MKVLKNKYCIFFVICFLIFNCKCCYSQEANRIELTINKGLFIFAPSNGFYYYLYLPQYKGYINAIQEKENGDSNPKMVVMYSLDKSQIIFIRPKSVVYSTNQWKVQVFSNKEYNNVLSAREDYEEMDDFIDIDNLYSYSNRIKMNWNTGRKYCAELFNDNFNILIMNFKKKNLRKLVKIFETVRINRRKIQLEDNLICDSVTINRIEQAYGFLNNIYFDEQYSSSTNSTKLYPLNILSGFCLPHDLWFNVDSSTFHNVETKVIQQDTSRNHFIFANDSRPSDYYVEFSLLYEGRLYANVYFLRYDVLKNNDYKKYYPQSFFSYVFEYDDRGILSKVKQIKVYPAN